jgi:hypothetical protein
LGVVLDSREAKNVKEVKQLLQWFSTAGIKYVVLYDMEGVSIFLTCFLTWVGYLLLIVIGSVMHIVVLSPVYIAFLAKTKVVNF